MRMLKGLLLAGCLTTTLLAQKESMLIGPGDEVNVEVFDTPDLDQNARVTDAGEFPLMLGGKVRLASLTPIEAARTIEAALIRSHVMYYPQGAGHGDPVRDAKRNRIRAGEQAWHLLDRYSTLGG